jgi:hypothetical protein
MNFGVKLHLQQVLLDTMLVQERVLSGSIDLAVLLARLVTVSIRFVNIDRRSHLSEWKPAIGGEKTARALHIECGQGLPKGFGAGSRTRPLVAESRPRPGVRAGPTPRNFVSPISPWCVALARPPFLTQSALLCALV